MANNTNVNKVSYNNNVLIDLTEDTITPEVVVSGYTAHDRSGASIEGTFVPVTGVKGSSESSYRTGNVNLTAEDVGALPESTSVYAKVGQSTIASISDAYAADALDITVGIEPVQAGSGDPSPTNVRPISGWMGANVVVSPTTDAQDGTTYPILWQSVAGTVYGGTLDVTTGLLTVTMAEVDLGTLDYQKYEVTEGTLFRTNVPLIKEGPDNVNLVCSNYATTHTNRRRNNTISKSTKTRIDIIDNSYSDAATFKAAMSGVQLVYELATPQTYQLSPTDVALLMGVNNVWADTGETTVEYLKADSLSISRAICASIDGIPVATGNRNGLMSSADKTKLDSIEIALSEIKSYLGIS